jgi:hypothetical protein
MKDHSPKRLKFDGVSQPLPSRAEKLARLKREIEQGAYQVNSEKLADMLIINLLLSFQNSPIFTRSLTDIRRLSPRA